VPDNVHVINARRSYEMPMDVLRLSMICTDPVMDLIRTAFGFQISQVGPPMQTVGEVQGTVPPGAVFNIGSFANAEGVIVPIRFLHFEPRRVVIDVAGPSGAAEDVWNALQQLLATVQTGDAHPVLGEPSGTIDASEISARLDVPAAATLAPGLTTVAQAYGLDVRNAATAAVFQPVPEGSEFQGMGPGQFGIQVRAGTKPSDQIFYSGAPLESGRHLAYLVDLESALKNP
jgi:hypothetical protein